MTDRPETGAITGSDAVTWIFNPFYYIAGGQALALGLSLIVAAGLLGWVGNAHLDGVLDVHIGLEAPIWLFVAEGVIDWLVMALVLLAAGAILSGRRFRALDIFGTQALARGPSVLLVAVAFIPGFQVQSLKLATGNFQIVPAELAAFVVGMLVTVFTIIWMVILMYRGFAVSCNVRGGKATGAFIVSLILAEILSKAAVAALCFLTVPGFRLWFQGS